MYVTWFIYITPVIPIGNTILLVGSSGFLWYNFLRAWLGDPGIIKMSEEERYQVFKQIYYTVTALLYHNFYIFMITRNVLNFKFRKYIWYLLS